MDGYTPLRIDVFCERVTAAGELDMATSPAVVEAVLKIAGPNRCRLDLDLSQISFIDSSGLHALLQLRAQLPKLRVVACSSQVERLFEMSGMSATFLEPA
ncbi:MAG: STAS domain-containing protein [Acidimicrobiales bacterium]